MRHRCRAIVTTGLGLLLVCAFTATTALAAGLPIVETTKATKVLTTESTLNGYVQPNGAETNYYFEYGTTVSYGSSTPEAGAGSGTTAVKVSKTVTGLMPSTTYHVRVVAKNSFGTRYGNDVTFTTTSSGQCEAEAKGEGVLFTWCIEGKDLAGEAAFSSTIKPGTEATIETTAGELTLKISCKKATGEGDLLQEAAKEPKLTHASTTLSECHVVTPSTCQLTSSTIVFNGGKTAGLSGETTVWNGLEAVSLFPAAGHVFAELQLANNEGKFCHFGTEKNDQLEGKTRCELPERSQELAEHVAFCNEKGEQLVWQGGAGQKVTLNLEQVIKLASGKKFSLRTNPS
jgi:hypothetical protein